MNRDNADYTQGYQAAFKDLYGALERGGVTAVFEWLANNTKEPERTAAVKSAARRWNVEHAPPPIFSPGDVDALTIAMQHWLGLGHERYTMEQIGRLFYRLARARQLALDSADKFKHDGSDR